MKNKDKLSEKRTTVKESKKNMSVLIIISGSHKSFLMSYVYLFFSPQDS